MRLLDRGGVLDDDCIFSTLLLHGYIAATALYILHTLPY